MKILIAEDEATSAFLLNIVVQSAGHQARVTTTGKEAYKAFLSEDFDAVITDWMMPELDGIELVKKIRAHARPTPLIIMVSALSDPADRQRALLAGVDGYVDKPIAKKALVELLESCFKQRSIPLPIRKKVTFTKNRTPAPAVAVGIAASTGGPPVLAELVSKLPTDMGATFFITQHGPDWTLKALVDSLQFNTAMPVHLAKHGMKLSPNAIYLAPGSHHLMITKSFVVRLSEQETCVGLIPAADPMFSSIAEAYGEQSIGVVLTGLGRDGSVGGQSIFDAGGRMIAQNPKEAVAPFMPEALIKLGLCKVPTDTRNIPQIIRKEIAARTRPQLMTTRILS